MSGPAYHARTHLPGGTDPLHWQIPAGDLDDVLLTSGLDALWKLNELEGDIANDSSGNEWHLQVPSGYVAADWGNEAGPPGQPTAMFQAGVDDHFSRTDTPAFPAYPDDFTASGWVKLNESGSFIHYLIGQGNNPVSTGGVGWALMVGGDTTTYGRKVMAGFNDGSGSATIILGNNELVTDGSTWYYLAVVRDAGTFKLYVDGLLQTATSSAAYVGTTGIRIGDMGDSSPSESVYRLDGQASYFGVWPRALSSLELLAHIEAAESGVSDTEGWVWGLDENGNPGWVQPGVSAGGGGGQPDDTPTDSPNVYLGDPADPSGWHYTAHYETAILYDSNPGRFDVPSRTWTRVPFNTIRLLRTWEVEVDGETRQQLLPDDRGLTPQARKGILHLADGMGYEIPGSGDAPVQAVEGFIYPEYPALDFTQLPQSAPEEGNDDYCRSFRFKDLAAGVVLRNNPDPYDQTVWRFFAEWGMYNTADGKVIAVLADADNIYPQYPVWPVRPLNLPGPYPQLDPASTMEYMVTAVGNHGWWYLLQYDHELNYAWAAGRNFVIEAWQDSPWMLRFMTGEYPNYGLVRRVLPEWQNRPFLSLTYNYNPALINHETGAWVG